MQILLSKFREIRGHSQSSLAKLMKISQSYISKVESGKRIPTAYMLIRFAETLEISVCELFPEEYRNCPYKNNSNPEAR